MTRYSTKWIKDPIDTRDVDALKMIRTATPPPAATNRDIVRIINQKQLGTCTTFAAGQIVRAASLVQQVEDRPSGVSEAAALAIAQIDTPFMSFLFAYYLARAYDGFQNDDFGTYIRRVFQVINKYGFPPDHVWPYSDEIGAGAPFMRMPSPDAFREAYDQRASVANIGANLIDYSRIMPNVDPVTGTDEQRILTIKNALADRHLIAFGTPITEDFCNGIGTSKVIDRPRSDQKIAGGHAMCIVGYDGDEFDIANSWSESFGDRGFVKFSRRYIEWAQTEDLWIVKRAPLLQKAA